MTNEEMLKALIEAQAVGGFKRFYPMSGEWKGVKISEWGSVELRETLIGGSLWHILQILLDTDGCKAAYGEDNFLYMGIPGHSVCQHYLPKCNGVAMAIIEAWWRGPGNNINAAIKTAFDLLPPSR